MKEKLVWEGAPTQVANLGAFLMCLITGLMAAPLLFVFWDWQLIRNLVAGVLFVPVLHAFWRYLVIRCTRYELTTERLRVTYGVFTRRVEELELYRVQDTVLVEPLLMRLCGYGCVEITASDPSTPRFVLTAIPGAETCRELIRTYVEVRRNRKRISEIEMAWND